MKATKNKDNMPVIRCAAYTRKSTDEGLDSDFNSLDAQREACEAYVTSQRHEGWVLLPERYDDGGFTGANMDRPALQRLINDIEAGKIDLVLIYKIDRLSRSLLDFAKLMEFFEQHGVSFTSITQNFSSNTAMGRLTMHVLLSFAAFERDIIAERVRDKIAGAKRKGMFTGGTPVLGYDIHPETRKLVVNADEAKVVRFIFKRYCETGSGQTVARELNERGIKTKSWTTKTGKVRLGKPWNGPGIYRLISNKTYLGLTLHKDISYPGEHQAIVSQSLWDRVHGMLTHDGRTHRRGKGKVQSLLKGIIRCGHCDSSMYGSYTKKGGKVYRYYTCVAASKNGYSSCPVRSVAAGEIEEAVMSQLRVIMRTPEMIAQTYFAAQQILCEEQADGGMSADVAVTEAEVAQALRDLDEIWEQLFPAERHRIARALIERVTIHENDLDVRIRTDGMRSIASELKGTSKTCPA